MLPPDGCSQWLAQAETNADGNAYNQEDDEDLGDDFSAFAQVRPRYPRTLSSIVALGGLSTQLPLVFAWPDLLVVFAVEDGGAVIGGCGQAGRRRELRFEVRFETVLGV